MTEIAANTPVILIDDEADIRAAWAETLALDVYQPRAFADGNDAIGVLEPDWPGVVITDLQMPGLDGFEVLERVRRIDQQIPVIIVTGHGDIPMAIRAVRAGAYDFIEKPAEPEMMLATVSRAVRMRALILENRALVSRSGGRDELARQLIGSSGLMVRLRQQIETVAQADVNTVVYGETGTGKELVARALHYAGRRRGGPFVALNCGAPPDALIASELFGHEKGAFTGALQRRIGRLEQASGGTLFLDEIESMPLDHQTQLLRALQAQVIERVGGTGEIPIDVRVIAASKVDLETASADGDFRSDLYYRLAVVSLDIPPLRARGEDVPLIFLHYVTRFAQRHGIEQPAVSSALLEELSARPWKGNVRELVNFAERFVLGIEAVSPRTSRIAGQGGTLQDQIDAHERRILIDALRRTGGRAQQTADLLGIPRKKLYLRLQHHNIERSDFHDGVAGQS